MSIVNVGKMRVSAAPSAKQVVSSVGWSSVQIIVEQASLFLIFVVLARLLDPATFGVVALAVIFSELGKVIASNGLAAAVIQTPDLDEAAADAAFWVNFMVAILIGLIMVACAFPVSMVMKQTALANALVALAIVPTITSMGAIHAARNIRGFGYKALALRTLAANILGGSVAILLAFHGHGIWALIAQRLIAESVLTIASWLIFPWMPRARLNVSHHRKMLMMGAHVTMTNVVFTLGGRMHELVMTAFGAFTAVGLLRIGFRLIEITQQFTIRPITSVALPVLARLAHDRDLLQKQYLTLQSAIAMTSFPIFFGFALTADFVVPFVFGPHWGDAVPVVQVLAFLSMPMSIAHMATPVLNAVGKPQISFRIAIIQLMLGTLVCVIAAPFGVRWVAVAYVSRAFFSAPYVAWELRRWAAISPWKSIERILPAAAAAAAMTVAVVGANHLINGHASPFVRFIVDVGIGGASYIAFLALVNKTELEQLISNWRSRGAKEL